VCLSTLFLPRESFSHCCCNSQAPGSVLFVCVHACAFLCLRVCASLCLAGSDPGHCAVVHYVTIQRHSGLPDEAVQFMEQPANSSCFWLGLCLVVRYSIDFLSLVPLSFLCRYAPVLSTHSLRKGRGRREQRMVFM